MTCTLHRADEELLEKWRCLGDSVLSFMEVIVMFVCLFFHRSSIYHCLGSTDGGGFGKLLEHAVLYLLLLFLALLRASQCAFFSGWRFVFSQLGTEPSLQLRSFAKGYCFQMYFYEGKNSEPTSWIYCFVLFNTFEIFSFDKMTKVILIAFLSFSIALSVSTVL